MKWYVNPGREDVSVWLQDLNKGLITTLPVWIDDADTLVVCLQWTEENGLPELGVAESRDDMLAAIRPGRLWFCQTSKADFLADTKEIVS